MSESASRTSVTPQRPVNRFSTLDNTAVRVTLLAGASVRELVEATGVSPVTAKRVAAASRTRPPRSVYDFLQLEDVKPVELEQLRRCALFAEDTRLAITDVVPVNGLIFNDKPFALRVSYSAAPPTVPILVSVGVRWAGEPFVVEKKIGSREAKAGYVDVPFGKDQRLPTGPAAFDVSLFTAAGSQARFRITCAVLPSNPFDLSLSPNANFVTGTFSARGVRDGGNFVTAINVTLSNGDGAAVPVSSQFTWKFWDGGVGGSLVEQGTGDFGVAISVPAFNTWGGWITVTSPPGSGIFNKYDGREDMTIEIIMHRADGGGDVSGTITARTMFRFALNITEVAGEDYIDDEPGDLWSAAQVTKAIYERRDLTIDFGFRQIGRAGVGGFEVIDSDNEARDLWEQWSGPGTNHNIDVFVVQLVAIPISGGGTADGLDGDIPGPTSHDGRSSGTVASKSGFVDASGRRQLSVEYLGMLLGHEVGHYLGLSHTNEAGNLMLPNSGTTDTNLNYDPQYRTMIRHGWVDIS